jgi:hypothetical protein
MKECSVPRDEALLSPSLLELRESLRALEQGYLSWDLDAIARHGATCRGALELVRQAGLAAAGAQHELLREVLALCRRCQALAAAGSRLAGSLARMSALTYEPAPAETIGREESFNLPSRRRETD